MEDRELLEQLEDLARGLGIELRGGEGEFTGGLCRVGEKKILFLNSCLSPPLRIQILCRELSRFELSHLFLLPAVRQRIEAEALSCSQSG